MGIEFAQHKPRLATNTHCQQSSGLVLGLQYLVSLSPGTSSHNKCNLTRHACYGAP